MGLSLIEAAFDARAGAWRAAHTDNRQVLSILFDELSVHSGETDQDAAPQVLSFDGRIRCEGAGWVAVQVRGDAMSSSLHGWAHAKAWANGRALRAESPHAGEPWCASVVAPVRDGTLRVSLLLLAQRDLKDPTSAAACWLDSIDLTVIERKTGRPA